MGESESSLVQDEFVIVRTHAPTPCHLTEDISEGMEGRGGRVGKLGGKGRFGSWTTNRPLDGHSLKQLGKRSCRY